MTSLISLMIYNMNDIDYHEDDDARTLKILCSIANTISELKFTYNCPSMNDSKMVPILDTQFYIEDNTIKYQFYKKKVASPFVVMRNSAISNSIKRSTIFQEGIRRLSNTSIDLDPKVTTDIMTEFSNALRISGYTEKYRKDILEGIMKRWKDVLEMVRKGERVLHRSQEAIRYQKSIKKGRHSAT